MPPNGIHEVHLNLNVRGLPMSATLAINELSARLQAEGREVFRLGLGQSPFPVPLPVVEELRANAHQKDYLPVRGLPALQESVAGYFERTQQLHFDPRNIIVGPGSKELMFLLQLVYYGDLVIPTPSWVSYEPQAHIIGRHVRWLSTRADNDWLLTPEELHRLCRSDPTKPRIVILNYPNNPTGCSYREEQLQELAEAARQYRLILLSDEIYGELKFDGGHRSIARYYPEGTIISTGLSKWCGAGGWRLGTFAFPKELDWLADAMAVVASETFTATSAPIQYAAVRAFRGGMRIEDYLRQSRRILRALGARFHARLLETGLHVAKPTGAFYLFADFAPFHEELEKRGIQTGEDLCRNLLEETGVAVLPGSAFGRPPAELTMRLATVDFDGSRALAAAEQVPPHEELDDAFLALYCPKIIAASDRIRAWIEG